MPNRRRPRNMKMTVAQAEEALAAAKEQLAAARALQKAAHKKRDTRRKAKLGAFILAERNLDGAFWMNVSRFYLKRALDREDFRSEFEEHGIPVDVAEAVRFHADRGRRKATTPPPPPAKAVCAAASIPKRVAK